jgi:hypothetical protein
MSAQARLIVVLREKEGIDNDERQRLGESERARGSEKKENRRKSIAVSHYHHRRSFACLESTSLLNSIFLTANMRLIVNARAIFFSKIFLKGLV